MEKAQPTHARSHRRALWLALVFFALLAFASTLLRPEPIYSEQPLSYWVERLADPATAENAASVIGEMGPEAVPVLRDALHNKPTKVALAAHEVAVFARLAAPRRYAPEEIRATAAYVLGQLGKDAAEAADDLVAALNDDDHHVRRRASWALARIGKPAAPALEAALTNPEPVVRIGAAKALAEIRKPKAIAVE